MTAPTARVRSLRLLLLTGVAAAVMGLSSHTASLPSLALTHAASYGEASRRITYSDLPPTLRHHLAGAASTEQSFDKYLAAIDTETARRVAEGDREHLIYYALQSARFTSRPRIEPAVSARRFVEGLSEQERERLLADPAYMPRAGWPPAERARMSDLLSALQKTPADARLAYFREVLASGSNSNAANPDAFYPDYVRVARFLYQKEFSAGRDAAQVAQLYRSRAHSSDTQIDAGFGVYIGLGIIRALEPSVRMGNVLVVGPGLDVAPRTDLIDAADLQSYQPLAVADALLALSLASAGSLRVHSVDVNPRVVRAVHAIGRGRVTLHLLSGTTESSEQPFSTEYRTYLRGLGRAIGDEVSSPGLVASDRRYQHSISVRTDVARAISAEQLNVITERLVDEAPFDLVIATNVLPYFDDRQLALALSNIAAMLRPGGHLVHNEARAGLPEMAGWLGMPVLQMRSLVLGGPPAQPLYDVVWLHQKPR